MDWQLKTKIWIEHGDRIVLSARRVQLLEAVDATGSLTEASRRLGWPYRRAWDKIRELERNLGVPLVETATGGYGGGGRTHLTEPARELIRRYHRFAAGVEQTLAEQFRQAFGDFTDPQPPPER